MDKVINIVTIIILINIIYLSAVNCGYYNVSCKDLYQCKEYDATSGYGYQKYFKIDDVNDHHAEGSIINLKLYVMGPRDAHILLSTEESPSMTDPVYEIVLGGGANTFSEIRRKRKTQSLLSVRRKNLLSSLNPIPITIKISLNGSIEVAVVGEDLPLLNTTDKNPLPIKYISFSSWGTAETKFFYDCQSDFANTDELEETKDNVLPQEMKLTLRLYSLLNEDNSNIDTRNISIQFELGHIAFRTKDATLVTRGKFNLRWTHPRQLWDPNDYDGLGQLNFRSSSIWRSLRIPPILLINSKDSSFSRGLNLDFKIQVHYSGEIISESTEIAMNTLCSDIGSEHNWPVDEVTCDILLGVIDENIALVPEDNDFFKIKNNNFDQSEWHLKSVQLKDNFSSTLSIDLREFSPVEVAYSLRLKRSTLFYNKVFSGPLVGAFIFVLLSFWTKHFLRASLNLIGMLILTTMVGVMMDYSPKSYVPQILKYYQISLYLSWLAFIFFIVTCWLEQNTPKTAPFEWLARCMRVTWLRLLIGLDIPNSYNHLNEEGVSWISVNFLFNRIVFFVYSILFLVGIMHGI